MTRWTEASSGSEKGVRREVLFFPSGGDSLYGSMYASERLFNLDPSSPRGLGLVVCPSWGYEVADLLELSHAIARRVALDGGAGFVYHPPGHGDSTGGPEHLVFESLVRAALDAAYRAAGLVPAVTWRLTGIRLGASVAVLAVASQGASRTIARLADDALPLVQPALDPAGYFEEMEVNARRLARISSAREPVLFGHPFPDGLRLSASRAGVERALAGLDGRYAVVRCASPPSGRPPAKAEEVTVQARWRGPNWPRDLEAVASSVVNWTRSAVRE